MTKEQFYEKWKPNGFYEHNPAEFMKDLDSVIKTEQEILIQSKQHDRK